MIVFSVAGLVEVDEVTLHLMGLRTGSADGVA